MSGFEFRKKEVVAYMSKKHKKRKDKSGDTDWVARELIRTARTLSVFAVIMALAVLVALLKL